MSHLVFIIHLSLGCVFRGEGVHPQEINFDRCINTFSSQFMYFLITAFKQKLNEIFSISVSKLYIVY